MDLDIRTGIQTAFILAVAGIFLSLFLGIRSIKAGAQLMYYRKKQELIVRGWRLIFAPRKHRLLLLR